MTKRSTKQQLLLSAISLLLCVSMLVGSTFAWFTDSVTSTNNIIKSGTLDVKLEYSTDFADWKEVDPTTNIFKKDALWEPGYTEVVYLRVSNVGTLALKYDLGINVASETPGTLEGGASFKLSDYIYFDAIEDVTAKYADRDAARAAVDGAVAIKTGYTKAGELAADATVTKTIALVVYMPETVGNEANYRGTQPQINLGLNLFATQLQAEKDSFDETYDKDADFYPAWDGSGDVSDLPAEVDNVITINTAAELAAFAAKVNAGDTFSGKTVKLGTNINLGNEPWTPIGLTGDVAGFQGTFDGQNYTIYNLKVDNSTRAYQSAGLFGSARYATIMNLKIVGADIYNLDSASDSSNGAAVVVGSAQFPSTIDNVDVENVKVTGNRRVAAIAGYYAGTITNCDVKNATITAIFDDLGNGSYDNADKVGGIFGYMNTRSDGGISTVSNNTVEDSTIIGYRDVGGIAGFASYATLTNNSVKNVTLVINDDHNYKKYTTVDAFDVEAIAGEGTADATNTAENVNVITGNISGGRVEYAGNRYQIAADFSAVGVKDLAVKVLDVNGDLLTTITPEAYQIPADGIVGDPYETSQYSWNTVCATVTSDSSSWQNTDFTPVAEKAPASMVLVINGIEVGKTAVTQHAPWTDVINGVASLTATVNDSDSLIAAINGDYETILLENGTYNLRFTNNTAFNVDGLKLIGLGDDVKVNVTSSEVNFGRIQGNNVIFENIDFSGNATLGTTGKATYNDCTFNQLECASSGSAKTYANNCTMAFFHTSVDMTAGDAYVTGCTITKAEYSGSSTIYFENCTIGELISWNMNTVLTNCKVTTIDDTRMTTATIVVK